MIIAPLNKLKLDKVVQILSKGGLVVYPTETVYGIGADATNTQAIKKLNKYKKRPVGKPYSIAVCDKEMAERYVTLNDSAKKIYNTLLPGPVTVISKGKHKVAAGVESELGTLGIRIPDYPLLLSIIRKFGRPITATSANASYQKRPYEVSDILDNISEKQKGLIDLIIDGGVLLANEPSTVIDTTQDDTPILRQGDVVIKDKSEILSRSEENTKNFAKELWQKYESYSGKRAIVFALRGEMGSGKTIFTKGLAKAMGIDETIVSPTYNLIVNYNASSKHPKLSHVDVWRLKDSSELKDLNIISEVSDKSILSIEWADKISDHIRKFKDDAVIIWVDIKMGKTDNERIISWGNH